jgi:DNA-binding transcriptional MerR regulator
VNVTLRVVPSLLKGGASGQPETELPEGGLRIGDAASRFGVSARTLRYYEELGLLSPSSYTSGGERRYDEADLEKLGRILELRDVLGMNLDEIKGFLDSEQRLEELRNAYLENKDLRTSSAENQRRSILEEILALNEALADQLGVKLTRMKEFRNRLLAKAERCRELLADLD